MILNVYCFKNGTPTEAKIRPETGSERECLWKAICMILWWILVKNYLKTDPKKGLQKNGMWRRLGASWGRLGVLKSMGPAASAARWRSRRAHSLGFLRIILYVYP